MTLPMRTAIVTGAGQGIGLAIARALAQEGVRVFAVDLDPGKAADAAAIVGGIAHAGDLRDAEAVAGMIRAAEAALGEIDLLVSNAGFARGAMAGPGSASDGQWQDSWDLHVMAHLRAARALLPGMIARGQGWLVNVASAAGLLSQIGDAPYSASKHASVSLAQSLAIEHGSQGIRASVVCPLYVATPLLGYAEEGQERPGGVIEAEDVARALIEGLRSDRFLILPHPEAADHMRRRAADMDRWIRGMQRLHDRVFEQDAPDDLAELHRRI
jgi:NAD(P)-dependent dehydrogenase (short-subunit alcohol dehydrogenase family)